MPPQRNIIKEILEILAHIRLRRGIMLQQPESEAHVMDLDHIDRELSKVLSALLVLPLNASLNLTPPVHFTSATEQLESLETNFISIVNK